MFECSEPSQILGRPFDELVPACALSLRPGAPLNGERDNPGAHFVHTRGDGTRLHIELTRTLFRRRSGEFHVIHTRDVTRQKQIERQLGEAQTLEAVGRLVGGVAHDFNNLLTGIMLYCDLLIGELEKAVDLSVTSRRCAWRASMALPWCSSCSPSLTPAPRNLAPSR